MKTFKYLGLVLDENLTFKQHIDHVMKTIRPFIPLMWKRGKYIPIGKRQQLYFAYVQSHIAYMLPIYKAGSKAKLKRLQRVQNRCIKALYRLPHLTSSTHLYWTSILPVEKLAVVERVTQLHKMANGLTKHNFDIQHGSDVHSYRTRQSNNFRCPDKHPILKLATHEYNELCNDLRHLSCIKTFELKLKIEVMKNASDYNVISPYFYLNWNVQSLF